MISTTTLVLATLVFNAASSFGIPVRIPAAEYQMIPRAEVPEPVLPRAQLVEVEPQNKRSNLGRFTRRSVRLPREIDLENEVRDTAQTVEARDTLPEIEKIVRRYPRQYLRDFYEARSETHPAARDVDEAAVERRYPRAALYERYEKRMSSNPVEEVQARAPEAVLEDSARRLPRRALTKVVKRENHHQGTPINTPPVDNTPPVNTSPAPNTWPLPSTSHTGTSSHGTSGKSYKSYHGAQPVDVAAIVDAMEQSNSQGTWYPGHTTKETTVIVNKITYDSGNGDEPYVSATTVTLGAPAPTSTTTVPQPIPILPGTESGITPPNAPSVTPPVTGDVPVQGGAMGGGAMGGAVGGNLNTPPVNSDPALAVKPPAQAGSDPALSVTPPATGSTIRRGVGSGAALASSMKRNSS